MTTTKPTLLYVACGTLALFALLGTWGHNVAYLPLGFWGANRQFVLDTLVNPAARSITFDILVLSPPVFYWMFSEARRLSLRGIWLYVAASMLIAISVALPVFLIHRAHVLTSLTGETARFDTQPARASLDGSLTRADWVGLSVLACAPVAYFVAAFSQ